MRRGRQGFRQLIVPAGGAACPQVRKPRGKRRTRPAASGARTTCSWMALPCSTSSFTRSADFLAQLLRRRNLSIDDFDLVLFHQAGKTMVDLLYKQLRVPVEKRFYYLERVGNSSGASLPSLLAEAWREGKIEGGRRTLLCSFGGGLSSASSPFAGRPTPPPPCPEALTCRRAETHPLRVPIQSRSVHCI